jgi:hypothetical protein
MSNVADKAASFKSASQLSEIMATQCNRTTPSAETGVCEAAILLFRLSQVDLSLANKVNPEATR